MKYSCYSKNKHCKCGKKMSDIAKLCAKCYFKTLKGKGNPMYGVHRFGNKNPNWRNGGKKNYCIDCGKKIYVNYSKRCRKCAQKGKLNHQFRKEGSKRCNNGYIFIKYKNQWIQEHRYIVQLFIGRKLKPQEVIHHIDGNTKNNKWKNLYVFPKSGLHTCFEALIRANLIDKFILKSNLKTYR